MNSQAGIALLAVVLLVGVYFVAKVVSRGRWRPSYAAAEGIVVGLLAAGCLVASVLSGQFR